MRSGPMTMIELLSLDRKDWERMAEDPLAFAGTHKLSLGADPQLLRAVGQQTLNLFERTGVTAEPWSGYLAMDRAQHVIVGTCGFKAPPDDDGVVEIAYFTFPDFEGRGYGSAMAIGLVERARRAVECGDSGLTHCRGETRRRGFWKKPDSNSLARLSIQKMDPCGDGSGCRPADDLSQWSMPRPAPMSLDQKGCGQCGSW
jgi:GNAT superfamily N-acetyltransferase